MCLLLILYHVDLSPRWPGELRGWQVEGREHATALKFPKRHFLGWLIKLCALAYRSFPGFKEEREKRMQAEAKE